LIDYFIGQQTQSP